MPLNYTKKFPTRQIILLFVLTLAFCVSPVQAQTSGSVVHAVMFWMAGCPHCEDVIQNVLPPLNEKYGTQFDLFMIEVKSSQDVDNLYRVAASYNFAKEQTGVPFLIIGDQVLIGSDQVRGQLPKLIEENLSSGGLDWPTNPILADLLPTPVATSAPFSNQPIATQVIPTQTIPTPEAKTLPPAETRSNGMTLAAVVFVGMILALLYALFGLLTGKLLFRGEWMNKAIPWLSIVGLFVAAYLTYVETQSAKPFCGPVGDCEAVQASSYSRIWGILPVGLLGALGYIAILAAWFAGRMKLNWKLAAYIPTAIYGMALFGTIFSVYLTYLELFVIKAVCIWCISSAIIITLILLLSLESALPVFDSSSDDDELEGEEP
jgi:uncharacterized membrane protein